MPFVKGQSGNPSGRSKGWAAELAQFQKLSPEARKLLATMLKSAEKDSDRIRAAEIILERAWGKAAQPVTGEGGEGPVKVDTSAALLELAEALKAT